MKQINIYLAGDSTVQTYSEDRKPQAGWGQFIGDYFTENITVYNHAIGGRSSKSFIMEGRLARITETIQSGDYLFIQMGHNDSTKSRPERYTEPYGDYKKYLTEYIVQAKEKGAHPILITPVCRLHCVNGEFLNDFGDYCQAMKEVAIETDVPIIDLMETSLRYLKKIGYEAAKSFYMISANGTDCTHFTEKGAREMARLVSGKVKETLQGLSLFVRDHR